MIAAFDVDLGRWAWAIEKGAAGQGVHRDPLPELPETITHVLIEVAGPVMHRVGTASEACPYNKRRWMIYNIALAAQIDAYYGPFCTVLVSPSTDWTLGYDEPTRQALAGIKPTGTTKSGARKYAENHDIRECRAMIHLYRGNPAKWRPLSTYLANL